MNDSGNLSPRTKAIVTLAIVALYALVPIDVIPDAMAGLGQIDDIIVFALGVASVVSRMRKRAE